MDAIARFRGLDSSPDAETSPRSTSSSKLKVEARRWRGVRGANGPSLEGEKKAKREEAKNLLLSLLVLFSPSFQKRLIENGPSRRQVKHQPPRLSAHCYVTGECTTWHIRPRKRGSETKPHEGGRRAGRSREKVLVFWFSSLLVAALAAFSISLASLS